MKRLVSSVVLAAALSAAFFMFTSAAGAAHQIEEQIVAPPWQPGTRLTLSAKGMRVASVHKPADKFIVTIDGKDSPPYDEVFDAAPRIQITYQKRGRPLACAVKRENGFPAASLFFLKSCLWLFRPLRAAFQARFLPVISVVVGGCLRPCGR